MTERTDDPRVDLAKVAKLVDALEKDLAHTKADEAHKRKLLHEIQAIKSMLKSPSAKHPGVRDSLYAIRQTLEHASATVSGEMWRDAPYLAEIGRILGLP